MMPVSRLARVCLALLAAAVLTACESSNLPAGPSSLPAAGSSLPGTGPSSPAQGLAAAPGVENAVWTLRTLVVADAPPVTIDNPEMFTLTLADGGKLNAKADCNRATGAYTLTANVLSVGPMAVTKAYCPSAPLDDRFLTLLGGNNVVSSSDTTLTLSSPRGSLTFRR